MGDSRRFHLFAQVIERHIPKDANIVDVAGGKGSLQAALRQLGYTHVTSWDKRPKTAKSRKGYRYGYFHYERAPREYTAVVAMHPDEGTDHAIMYAVKRRVPAVICPCCVRPSAVVYSEDHNYNSWLKHLIGLAQKGGMEVITTALKMAGRRDVLILKPGEK